MRIYFHYKTTDKPWGGINSFIAGLKKYILSNRKDIIVDESFRRDTDVFLMAASYAGPGQPINPDGIRNIIAKRDSLLSKMTGRNKFRIIHRLDGLRSFYAGKRIPNDDLQIELSDLADFIIFQSEYSLENFRHFGYDGDNYEIIFNGVDQNIFNTEGKEFYKGGRVKIFSTSWSDNIMKGFQAIADCSELDNTECVFAGRWCDEVDPKNVKVIPPVKQKELADLYKEADIFLHPAKNDPCPNVVLEAMSSGLPVIFHNSGGTPEIAGEYGVPLSKDNGRDSLREAVGNIIGRYDHYREKLLRDKAEFSIATAAEKYLKAFEKALKL